MADSALHQGLCSKRDVERVAARGWRGSGRLRTALSLADARSESPWESVLRLFHHAVDAEVVPQLELHDRTGAFVARGDLWLVGTRFLHEYDGADHGEPDQQRADLTRGRRLVGIGWTRRGYTAHDICRRPTALRRDIDAALGRSHDPGRLRDWFGLFDASLFSPRGLRAARRRWGT